MKKIFLVFLLFFFYINNLQSKEDKMIIKLEHGEVTVELFTDVAPKHVERIKTLAKNKQFDGVVFHRVISGFMAQTEMLNMGILQMINII